MTSDDWKDKRTVHQVAAEKRGEVDPDLYRVNLGALASLGMSALMLLTVLVAIAAIFPVAAAVVLCLFLLTAVL